MQFPESPREGTQAHASAVDRLNAAIEVQDVKSDARDAAVDTPAEHRATAELAQANEQVSAREAWVRWIERGY